MGDTLVELDPNYAVSFHYSKDNVAELLAEFSVRGLQVITRPGDTPDLVYAFTRVDAGQEDLYSISKKLSFIKDVCPLYDMETRKRLNRLFARLTKVGTRASDKDLFELARLTGNAEQSLYFTFFREFNTWLLPLACWGVICRIIFARHYSWEFNRIYTLGLTGWAIYFVVNWIYNLKPNYVKSLSQIQQLKLFVRKNYTAKRDPHSKVILKKCAFIPVMMGFVTLLVSLQLFCFSVEIFITQLYTGPLGFILSLLPTILNTVFVQIVTQLYNKFFVDKFVKWENGLHPGKSVMEKNFVLTFFINYTPLLITLFLYLPLNYKVALSLKHSVSRFTGLLHIPITENDYIVDIQRYRKQIFFFTIPNQIIPLALDNVLPLALNWYSRYQRENKKPNDDFTIIEKYMKKHYPKDLPYWTNFDSCQNSYWGEFNCDQNVVKLMIEFGFMLLFSTLWPLSPLFYLLANQLVLYLDYYRAIKKCRPISLPIVDLSVLDQQPDQEIDPSISFTDSWNVILEVCLFVGSVIGNTITYMYSKSKLKTFAKTGTIEKRNFSNDFNLVNGSRLKIFSFAVVFEHFIILSYFIASKVMSVSKEKSKKGYIPNIRNELPKKTNLLPVVMQTNDFMSQIGKHFANKRPITSRSNDEDIKSKKRRKSQDETKDIFKFEEEEKGMSSAQERSRQSNVDDQTSKPSAPLNVNKQRNIPSAQLTSNNEKVNQPHHQSAVVNKMIYVPVVGKQETSTRNGKDLHTGPEKTQSNMKVNNAGATLPDRIPTSQNYHLRKAKPNLEETHVKPLNTEFNPQPSKNNEIAGQSNYDESKRFGQTTMTNNDVPVQKHELLPREKEVSKDMNKQFGQDKTLVTENKYVVTETKEIPVIKTSRNDSNAVAPSQNNVHSLNSPEMASAAAALALHEQAENKLNVPPEEKRHHQRKESKTSENSNKNEEQHYIQSEDMDTSKEDGHTGAIQNVKKTFTTRRKSIASAISNKSQNSKKSQSKKKSKGENIQPIDENTDRNKKMKDLTEKPKNLLHKIRKKL